MAFFGEPETTGLRVIGDYLTAIADTWALNRAFRGHASVNWPPVPSALRPGVAGIDRQYHLDAWKRTARRFVSPQPANDLEYLVLAQHYGIPTALLDWTTNPLIALFFACQSVNEVSDSGPAPIDGQVLQLDLGSIYTIQKNTSVDVFKEDRSQPILLDTVVMNARATAQDSLMTLHAANEVPLDARPVFVVFHSQKTPVRTALRLFGISEDRIYADLTVAASNFRDALVIAHDL